MLFDFNQEKTLEISTLEELRDLYLRNKNDDEILTISFWERDYSFLNKINFETENGNRIWNWKSKLNLNPHTKRIL